jgi:hypothetical protein
MTVKINICNALDMPKYIHPHNKIQLQTLETPSYFNFIQTHTAEAQKTYNYYFSLYLRFNDIKDSDFLLQKTPGNRAKHHKIHNAFEGIRFSS